MLGQSKQYPKYWLAINPRGVTCAAWEWAQQHSFPCLLLQKKDGCFPRWRSSLKQKDEVMGQETGNRCSLPFLSTWKEPSLLHDAPEKKIRRTCAVSAFSFLAISSLRDRGMECYWDQGVGTRKTNAQPSLPLPLSRSKNDCVGHEGFTFALSQSECQGKSRLTFLASGKKKAIAFYVYILLS